MFSADLTPDERHSRLGHMASVPTAAFLSGADEFVPQGEGRPTPEVLAETLRAAMVASTASPATPPADGGAAAASGGDDGAGALARSGNGCAVGLLLGCVVAWLGRWREALGGFTSSVKHRRPREFLPAKTVCRWYKSVQRSVVRVFDQDVNARTLCSSRSSKSCSRRTINRYLSA